MKSTKLNVLALIPARGGSKGIPKKNLVNINGYPLLAYSIATSMLSKYINRTVVTTDSKEIARLSKKFGAETPFLRPKKISKDNSLDIEFFRHALGWLRKKEKYIPDLIVHLRPTTPARDPQVIDTAISEILKDKKATSLRSAERLNLESPYKMFKRKGVYYDFFGKEDFNKNEEYYNYPRQKFPIIYHPNGYVDIIKPHVLLKTGKLHGKKIRAFITENTAEIDSPPDIKIAEKALKKPKYKKLFKKLKELKR